MARRPSMTRIRAVTIAVLALVSACGGSATPAPAATSGGPVAATATATAQPSRAKIVVSYSNVLAHFFPAYVAKEHGIFDQNPPDPPPPPIPTPTPPPPPPPPH